MPSAESDPVSDREAADLFAPLRDRSRLALAVSGGADSSALLLLYARARGLDPALPPAIVLTVDHRLRPQAAAEARFVAECAARRGFAHRTLAWEGDKPASNLQAAARRARYALLVDAAEDLGCDTLLTAHHAEDQAETFLARLARGSGVLGLSAMARWRRLDGLMLHRPFLDLPRARLAASLRAAGETWCEDPSNDDPRYDRVRLRRAAPMLAELGLDRDRLVATARAMARAGEALEAAVDVGLAAGVEIHPAGWAVVRPEVLAALPSEIRLRLMARLIRAIGGREHTPELEPLTQATEALLAAGATGRVAARTLGGARLEQRRGRIWLSVEPGRGVGPVLRLEPGARGRLLGHRVGLAATAPRGVTVTRLGAAGRRALMERQCPTAEILGRPAPSAAVIESALAVFVGDALVACPGLGYEGPGPVRWGELLRVARSPV